MATDAAGVPLGVVSAGANRHDSPTLVREWDLKNLPAVSGPFEILLFVMCHPKGHHTTVASSRLVTDAS